MYNINDKVRHRIKPSEPFAVPGQYGHILRVTPSYRTVPAQAYINWGDFFTWEKLSDLI